MSNEKDTERHVLYIKTGGGLSRIVSQVPVTKKRKHKPSLAVRRKGEGKKD